MWITNYHELRLLMNRINMYYRTHKKLRIMTIQPYRITVKRIYYDNRETVTLLH